MDKSVNNTPNSTPVPHRKLRQCLESRGLGQMQQATGAVGGFVGQVTELILEPPGRGRIGHAKHNQTTWGKEIAQRVQQLAALAT